jgi:hypothetical protein
VFFHTPGTTFSENPATAFVINYFFPFRATTIIGKETPGQNLFELDLNISKI